jgi:type III secretion inner rod protein HrpB2
MTMPIPPLPPIATLVPPSAPQPTAATAPRAQPPGELVDLFRSKLEAARMAPPDASRVHGPSALTETITRQDQAFAQMGGQVDRFAAEAPYMSQQELVGATTKIQFEAAEMACKMYGGQMVAQGVKSSVQTLMKNQ